MARSGAMTLKSPAEIEKMRAAGRLTAQALEAMRAFVRPGVTTAEVDAVGAKVIRDGGRESSLLRAVRFPGLRLHRRQ